MDSVLSQNFDNHKYMIVLNQILFQPALFPMQKYQLFMGYNLEISDFARIQSFVVEKNTLLQCCLIKILEYMSSLNIFILQLPIYLYKLFFDGLYQSHHLQSPFR